MYDLDLNCQLDGGRGQGMGGHDGSGQHSAAAMMASRRRGTTAAAAADAVGGAPGQVLR